MQTTRTPYSISFMATVLLLLLFACHSTVANAAVALGATRVIYPANQKQVLLPVTNNDPASVYLIQSWIENAGDQKDTQFVITPPLFSMQGKKENTLRIWICPYISRHLLSLNPLQARCRRYSRGER